MKKVLLLKLLVLGALVVAGCNNKHNGNSSDYGLLGDDNVTVTVGDGSKDGNSTVNDDGTKGGDTNSTNGSGDNNGTNGNGGTDGNTTGGGGNSGDTNTTNSNDGNITTDDNTTLSEIKSINLKVTKTKLNKDTNTSIKVTAKTKDNKQIDITQKVKWLINPKGAVIIDKNTLMAKKDINTTIQAKYKNLTSNKIKLNIYWEVNGHILPPEPDPKVNNATLLGVDVNKNGVRDDVERYILQTYGKEEITIQIGFQVARAYNAVIEHPEKAKDVDKVLFDARDCGSYFTLFAKFFNEPILLSRNIVTSKQFKSVMLNTEPRIRAYLEYNRNLSGGVYDSTDIDEMKSKCAFDVDKLLKARR